MTVEEIDELWWRLDDEQSKYCIENPDWYEQWHFWELKFAIMWCRWKLRELGAL